MLGTHQNEPVYAMWVADQLTKGVTKNADREPSRFALNTEPVRSNSCLDIYALVWTGDTSTPHAGGVEGLLHEFQTKPFKLVGR
jgi:hypothetical protein